MAFWKEIVDSKTPPSITPKPNPNQALKEPPPYTRPEVSHMSDPIAHKAGTDFSQPRRESLIAADITIEGKIEGAGSIRIAGKFKGDVNVQGDLTIEAGAKLTGSVVANQVVISGELEGNIDGATRVDLQQTAVMTGDLKAGSLTVASGARMRGQAVFGWKDEQVAKPLKSVSTETSSTP